ncbi:DUF4263 domain-containing protein [Vibrio diabolicus]|uniref:DUF4263 domain-containing protein n=1 Tax=Vibrio diabolicus TaxID=50719 RepID=A0ABM6SDI6_9VIBR|nr:DUF4263 domain-containing protein [Vibrio diabolicus]
MHETTRSRIDFVPFYITKSHGVELAGKIITYKKDKTPFGWLPVDEKSVSLQAGSLLKLYEAIKSHVAVKDETEGDFLLIRVNDGTAQLAEHDPQSVANALKGSIRLKDMKSAVNQLRNHLNNQENDEKIYQKWCEEYPWAFGNAYVVNDDVRAISSHDHLDLMLSNVIGGFRDIIELKRPNMEVLNYDSSHRNFYFSSEVSKAIGQCHRYMDVFNDVASKGLADHPEIVAYHPRATIVIGRSYDWTPEKHKALHGLNSRLTSLSIMTYDHLLNQGERLVNLLEPSQCTESESNSVDNDDWLDFEF